MTAQNNDQKPDYLGHRARLKERFLVDDGMSMPDYELLELLLMYAIPRRDVKPLAKKLIKNFGNIAHVLNASNHDLVEKGELSENVVALLKAVATCGLRISSSYFAEGERRIFEVWGNFIDYCRKRIGYKDTEEFWVFFLNGKMELLCEKQISGGTLNSTYAPAQIIAKLALENKAPYVILAHNHPSGRCKPSEADRWTTDEIVQALETLDIEVYDHVIISQYDDFSFRAAGLIEDRRVREEKELLRREKEKKMQKKQKLLL
jgi:DNA repair protein RadC